MIQLEKGIEIPNRTLIGILEQETPIGKMEVGDSFLYPDNGKLASLVTRVSTYGKNKGTTYVSQMVDSGRRVWRTK